MKQVILDEALSSMDLVALIAPLAWQILQENPKKDNSGEKILKAIGSITGKSNPEELLPSLYLLSKIIHNIN
jgi:hypothetical protein